MVYVDAPLRLIRRRFFFLTAITGSETKYQFSTAGSHQSDEATPVLEIFGGEVAGADSATSPSAPRRMTRWRSYFDERKVSDQRNQTKETLVL